MDRRIFGGAALAGIAGLLFPQKSEGESIRDDPFPILEGLIDLEMAAIVGLGGQGLVEWNHRHHTLDVWLRCKHGPLNLFRSSWRVVGTVIHNTDSEYDTWFSVPRKEEIDITSLRKISIHPLSDPSLVYRRAVGKNGVGWFLV